MKKGCLIVLLLGLLALGGVVGFIFVILGATQPVVDASERFLTKLGQGKSAEAYASSGKSLRAAQSQASFDAAVKQLGLDGFQSASWSSRSMNNDRGEVKGTITTKGGTLPLEMVLVSEDGEWRVIGFHGEAAGGSVGAAKAPIPPDDELKRATLASLMSFNDAIRSKDFTAFHGTLAVPFQQKFTPAQLGDTFKDFTDAGVDLSPIKDLTPIFDAPPAVDANGVLSLNGYYPTQPSAVHFSLDYAYEHPTWKLVGIDVKVKKAEKSE